MNAVAQKGLRIIEAIAVKLMNAVMVPTRTSNDWEVLILLRGE